MLTDIKGEIDSNITIVWGGGALTHHLHHRTDHPDRKSKRKHRP